MSRACVIVLDAVGAGELPDAADWGDEGSDTLGNVSRAVGGLDLPNLEALGLGNVEPLEGCPPQPYAPAVAGRLLERSKGKDTTAGHWELMGVVTPTPFPTYPYGFPDEVIDPFMNRTGRGVLGNKPASGTEIIQELGEEHQRTGKWIVYTSADSVFQIAAHEETIPLEELYDACRVAREILTGKHAVGRVIARPFVGSPGHYERTPNRHDFSLEPRRPNYLTAIRDAGHTTYGVGKISDIFAGCDIDESFPTKSNVDGINRTIELLENIDSGFVFVNLVETDQLWGHRNDPVNFHRCLQDFDRRLPDILDALRDGDLLILTSDHGCDPTTPSTDHSREHALLLAYAAGKNAAGQDPRGRRVRRRRRDRLRLARREAPGKGRPGPADRREVTDARALNDPAHVRLQYESEEGLAARKAAYRDVTGPDPREVAFVAVVEAAPTTILEVGCGEGELAERLARETTATVVAIDQSERMVELTARARSRRARRRRPGSSVRRRRIRGRARRVDALPRAGSRSRARRDRARARSGRAPGCGDERHGPPRRAPRARGTRAMEPAVQCGERRGAASSALRRRRADRSPGDRHVRGHRGGPFLLRLVGPPRARARAPPDEPRRAARRPPLAGPLRRDEAGRLKAMSGRDFALSDG